MSFASHSRPFAGALATLVLGLCLCLVTRAASAWTYPLLPHVQGLAFFPEQPNDQASTWFELSAVYPSECWRLVDAQLIDSTRVQVTIEPFSPCGDSATHWRVNFDLGVLPAGMHSLTVHATVRNGTSFPDEEEITVPFEVVAFVPPPPPPIDSTLLLSSIEVIPAAPAPGEAVSIRLTGWTPFECTTVGFPHVFDPAHIALTFDYAATCADTSRQWERVFPMGTFAEGDYRVDMSLYVNGPDSSFIFAAAAFISVRDPNPPPPIDSTITFVNLISVEPAAPLVGDTITVRVRGRYPFPCGATLESPMLGTDELWLTLLQATGCSDTSRTWEHAFSLGALSAGDHTFELHLQVEGLATPHSYPFTFHVTDPAAPPPPVDSVRAGLSPSHPNPFRDQTSFAVSLDEARPADVAVFDLSGRRVAQIHHGMLPRGTSSLAWNGRRRDGSRAPGGIYFYRLTLPDRVVTRRVVLLDAP